MLSIDTSPRVIASHVSSARVQNTLYIIQTIKAKAARQAKMQAKDGMHARAIGTVGETVRAKAKSGKGVVGPKNGMARRDRVIGTPMWKGKSSTKGSSKGSMYSVDEVGDID